MDVSVIIPTYNEVENVKTIVPMISEAFKADGRRGEIVVVDDDSPDGTANAATELQRDYPVTVAVRRGERGLSSAVIKGFSLAKGNIVVVMDADLSHPVGKLAEMVSPIAAGECDATVGSRYVPGGDCDNWPVLRKTISRVAGFLARGVTRLSDPTSGFMAIRRERLDGVELDPIGWKIVMEVLVKTGVNFKEVPITFSDRFQGKSKFSVKTQIDYLRHLWRLYSYRYKKLFEFIKFGIVGLSGVVIDTMILVAFVDILSFDPRAAATLAFLGAVSWNYCLNRNWTFLDRASDKILKYLKFVGVCLGGLGVRIGVMHLLLESTTLREGHGYIVASVAGIIMATAFNFLASKYFVFRNREPA